MSELELLSHIAQPALTLAGMRVEFCNPAALAAGFVPGEELTLPETEGNAAAVMEHAGARYGAQLLGNVLLLTPLSEEPNLTGEQLENICAALRSPLSDLLAGAEVLFPYLEEQEDRMIQAQTARITRAYYRLVRAVSLMQSERALAAGLEQGNFAVTELCGFFAPLFSMTEGFCAEKGVTAQLSLPSRTFTAAIDPELLERAYYQLLSNALKAMGPGGSLSVRLEERESYASRTRGPAFPRRPCLPRARRARPGRGWASAWSLPAGWRSFTAAACFCRARRGRARRCFCASPCALRRAACWAARCAAPTIPAA